MKKNCSKCGESKPQTEYYRDRRTKDGLYSACRSCQKGYPKKWKDKNKEWFRVYNALPKNRKKYLVRQLTCSAVRWGKITKPSQCEMSDNSICKGRLEAHHNDYDKPLKVRWLCVKHHSEHHRKLRDKKRLLALPKIKKKV